MKDWTSPGHLSKISAGIVDVLTKEFHIMAKANKEDLNHELLIKISSAIGYQGMMYNTLWKSNELARRLKEVEKTMETISSEEFAMMHSPVLMEESKLRATAEFR